MSSLFCPDKQRREHWNTVLGKTEPDVPINRHGIAGASKLTKKVYKCNLCSTILKRRYDYHKHMSAVHMKEKPHVCDYCGRAFGHNGTLHKHKQTIHFGMKPFMCDECGRRFSEKGNLNKHITNKHITNNDCK